MTRSRTVSLAVLTLLLAMPAVADDHGNDKRFFVGVEVNSLQPSGAPMDFALSDPDDDNQPEGTINSIDFSSAATPRIYLGWKNKSGGTLMLSGWSYDEDEDVMLSATSPASIWDILYHADDAFDDYSGTAMALGAIEASVYDIAYVMPAHTSDKISINWQVGLRQASLDHGLAAIYDDTFSTNNVILAGEAEGLGLKGGVHGTFHLNKKWHVTAGAGMSLLSGDVDSSTLMFDGASGLADPDVDIVSEEDRVLTMFDASLSLVWSPTKSWYFWVGYEYSQWNDVIDTHLFPDDVSEGFVQTTSSNLTWDGATVGAAFVF